MSYLHRLPGIWRRNGRQYLIGSVYEGFFLFDISETPLTPLRVLGTHVSMHYSPDDDDQVQSVSLLDEGDHGIVMVKSFGWKVFRVSPATAGTFAISWEGLDSRFIDGPGGQNHFFIAHQYATNGQLWVMGDLALDGRYATQIASISDPAGLVHVSTPSALSRVTPPMGIPLMRHPRAWLAFVPILNPTGGYRTRVVDVSNPASVKEVAMVDGVVQTVDPDSLRSFGWDSREDRIDVYDWTALDAPRNVATLATPADAGVLIAAGTGSLLVFAYQTPRGLSLRAFAMDGDIEEITEASTDFSPAAEMAPDVLYDLLVTRAGDDHVVFLACGFVGRAVRLSRGCFP